VGDGGRDRDREDAASVMAALGFAAEEEAVLNNEASGAVAGVVGDLVADDDDLAGGGMEEYAGDEETEIVVAGEPFGEQDEAFVDGVFDAGEDVAGVFLEEFFGAEPAAHGETGAGLGETPTVVGVGEVADALAAVVPQAHGSDGDLAFAGVRGEGDGGFEAEADVLVLGAGSPGVIGGEGEFGFAADAIGEEVGGVPVAVGSRLVGTELGFVHEEALAFGGDVG